MYKCPHPECAFVAYHMITNNHCQTEHGMSRKLLVEKYGQPINLLHQSRKSNTSQIMRWAKEESPKIESHHFAAIENAANRLDNDKKSRHDQQSHERQIRRTMGR